MPEESEFFLLKLISVDLAKGEQRRGAPPSIRRQRSTAVVIIPANDDANGVIEFDIAQMPTIVNTYEISGQDATFELPLVRHTGSAGRLVVHWESRPSTASPSDYAPTMGTVTFEDNQRMAGIILAILDDDIPENDEDFDVVLTNVIGGGRLGLSNVVKVTIKRNDSPHGTFAFDLAQPVCFYFDSFPSHSLFSPLLQTFPALFAFPIFNRCLTPFLPQTTLWLLTKSWIIFRYNSPILHK